MFQAAPLFPLGTAPKYIQMKLSIFLSMTVNKDLSFPGGGLYMAVPLDIFLKCRRHLNLLMQELGIVHISIIYQTLLWAISRKNIFLRH
jgi:hypothetical protein